MDAPPLVSVVDAASILGCSEAELDRWRRTVLPSDRRREAAQPDDTYRPDEIVAIAVGLWLRAERSCFAESFAASLIHDMPEGDDWGVVKIGRATVKTFTGRLSVDWRGGRRVSHKVFDAAPVFSAIRAL